MPLFKGDPPPSNIRKMNSDELAATLVAGQTPRSLRLRRYRAYYDGTAYIGRIGFLDSRFDTPLRERAPCVISDAVRAAARANAARCVGEGRFPKMTTLQSEDDSDLDDRFGLDPDESAIVDAVIAKIIDQSDLQSCARVALEQAQAVGTACSILSVDGDGHLAVSDVPAEWCTPTFSPDVASTVVSLEIRYRYIDIIFDEQKGEYFPVVREFLRVIDQTNDTTFFPRLIPSRKPLPGEVPPFVVQSVVAHGLGFCPVIWWPFLQGTATIADVDGRAIHDGQLDNLDALNFALSQRHRGALVCGEPQYWETGVGDDENVAAGTRPAVIESSNPAPYPTANNPTGSGIATNGGPGDGGWAYGFGPGGSRRRQRSPLSVWHSENPQAHFGMLVMPSDGLKALEDHARDVLAMLRESFGSVFVDPAMFKGTADISGKALAVLNERQIAFCDSVRRDMWRRWLKPVVCCLLRIALARQGKGLYLAGADQAAPILKKFIQPVATLGQSTLQPQLTRAATPQTSNRWFDPYIAPCWGDYFPPSDNDENVMVSTALTASQAGKITDKTVLQKIGPVFNIENPDQYQEELEEERQKKAQQDIDQKVALANALPKPAPFGGPPGQPGQQPAKPPFGGAQGAAGDGGPRKVPNGADPADDSSSKKAKKAAKKALKK